MTIDDLSALLHKQCLFCWHLAGGAWLTFVAVTEPQERDEIPVMRVSTTTRHTQDSEQIVPEWMKERRGPRSLIPRDFQVAEAGRLAYTSLLAATRALVVLLYPAPVSCSPGE